MLRILHIEDDPLDAELVYNALAEPGPCLVSRVVTRAGFSAALAHEVFDLIVSDSSLPELDGKKALRVAKARFPHVPFVFCSGSHVGNRKSRMQEQGATDYFSKSDLDGLKQFVATLAVNQPNHLTANPTDLPHQITKAI